MGVRPLPFRPKPLLDESLSSWFSRVASWNGHTVPLFWNRLLPESRGFRYDLDMYGDTQKFLLDLSRRTGVGIEQLRGCVLPRMDSDDDPSRRGAPLFDWYLEPSPTYTSGLRSGIAGSGLQFCPMCYREAPVYFRKHWRFTVITCCPRHGCLLDDECYRCGLPYMAFEGGINGSPGELENCGRCGAVLAHAELVQTNEGLVCLTAVLQALLSLPSKTANLLKLIRELISRFRDPAKVDLRELICSHAGVEESERDWWDKRYRDFRNLRTRERAAELQLVAWLLTKASQDVIEVAMANEHP